MSHRGLEKQVTTADECKKFKSELGGSFKRDEFPAEELIFGSVHTLHLEPLCSTRERRGALKDGEVREGWINTIHF